MTPLIALKLKNLTGELTNIYPPINPTISVREKEGHKFIAVVIYGSKRKPHFSLRNTQSLGFPRWIFQVGRHDLLETVGKGYPGPRPLSVIIHKDVVAFLWVLPEIEDLRHNCNHLGLPHSLAGFSPTYTKRKNSYQ